MYNLAELRPGMAVLVEDSPYLVMKAQHSKQARGSAVAKTSLKNLLTGSIINYTFQGSDKVEPADVGYSKAQYLYADGSDYYFMDGNTYEQFSFTEEDLDEQRYFLVDGMNVDVLNFENRPIAVQLPPKVDLEVTHTDPGVKGDTASGGTKPATTQTSLVVNVPLFIEVGDKIRVNTSTKEYVERA